MRAGEPTLGAPLLELDHVSVRVGSGADGLVALDDVSLRIQAGERVALIGPSGAGKSTLLGLANAAVLPTDGSVRFRGERVQDSETWCRHHGREIATIHQQLHLVGALQVVHNVNAGRLGEWRVAAALASLVRARGRDRVSEALDAVGLLDRMHERTDRLSGGEQQRVAIARALVQRPALLLADEPVSSLDPARANDVVALLADVSRRTGSALLMSLHLPDLVRRHSERVLALRDGRLVFDAATADVSDADIEELYRLPVA